MLKLTRPIVFFDLEATGIDREKDKIVQIAMRKVLPGFIPGQTYICLVNPEMPIPQASTLIHGITDEMVKDAPTFSEIAVAVFEFITGCDLGGFNSNYYDVPMLYNELARCGIYLNHNAFHMIDVGNLFKIQEPRNLANAMQFYCGTELKGAHDAMNDTDATIQVFFEQLTKYPDLPESIEDLAFYTNYSQRIADLSGKFAYDAEGVLRINFGNKKGQVAKMNLEFVRWMYYRATFPPDTRAICEELLGITPVLESEDFSEQPF